MPSSKRFPIPDSPVGKPCRSGQSPGILNSGSEIGSCKPMPTPTYCSVKQSWVSMPCTLHADPYGSSARWKASTIARRVWGRMYGLSLLSEILVSNLDRRVLRCPQPSTRGSRGCAYHERFVGIKIELPSRSISLDIRPFCRPVEQSRTRSRPATGHCNVFARRQILGFIRKPASAACGLRRAYGVVDLGNPG